MDPRSRSSTAPALLLGAGSAAATLAAGLAAAGVPTRLWARRPERALALARALAGEPAPPEAAGSLEDALAGASLALLCVSDDAQAELAARAAPFAPGRGGVALTVSGFHGPDVLAPLAARGWDPGRLHPLVPLPPLAAGGEGAPELAERARRLRGAFFALGGGERARAEAARLVERLDGRALALRDDAGPAYHAAAALVANGAVALADAAREVLGDAVPADEGRRALAALLAAVADELGRRGARDALTGPAARGDARVVAGHLAVLARLGPAGAGAREIHRALTRRILAIARERGLDPAAARRVEALLEGSAPAPGDAADGA